MTVSLFSIKHFFGKVALGLLSLIHKTTAAVDTDAPEIEKILAEGASIASVIPGVGPEVAGVLNLGIQLLGDTMGAVDGTDSVAAAAQTQFAALAPAGYSPILVKSDVLADVATLTTTYKTLIAQAKTAVVAVSAPPTSPIANPPVSAVIPGASTTTAVPVAG